MEEYRDVKGYEGLYQVSNLGNVKSLASNKIGSQNRVSKKKEKIRSLRIGKNGYYYLNLSKENKIKSYNVHQLVAIAFLNHKPDGYNLVVDHVDNNKLNNSVENLQILTQRQNTTKYAIGKSKYIGVTWCSTRNKWRARITINGKLKSLGRYDSEKEAGYVYQKALINL